jgi:uncharacterized protein DUF4154
MFKLEDISRNTRRPRDRMCLARAALWASIAIALCLGLPCASYGIPQEQDELAVRAAFVFNLTKYVEWPHGGHQLTIGFLGEGPMGEALKQTLHGKTSDSRPIDVMLHPSDAALERCNLLYVAYSSSRKNREVIEKLRNREVLTIGETDAFARDRGIVGLVKKGHQIQIQINLEAARVAGIKVSSRLLSVATVINADPEGQN